MANQLMRTVDRIIKDNAAKSPLEQRGAILAHFGKPGDAPDSELGIVLREAVHEVDRRRVMAERRERRKERKQASKFGRRGEAYRRIIHTKEVPAEGDPLRKFAEENGLVREFHFHATKGWRSYRRVV